MKTFQQLRDEIGFPNKCFYRYLQIIPTTTVRFKVTGLEWSKSPLFKIIVSATSAKWLISKLYTNIYLAALEIDLDFPCRAKWEEVIQ